MELSIVESIHKLMKYMVEHLDTLRESQFPPPFTRACLFFITLTFRALGRNHTMSTPFEAIAMLCFSMNSGIPLLRSSSELIVHCTGKASKSISCPSIVTKREYIRHREASSSFRAAQISRQGRLNPILRGIFFPKLCVLDFAIWDDF